jgi:hypothetical protein
MKSMKTLNEKNGSSTTKLAIGKKTRIFLAIYVGLVIAFAVCKLTVFAAGTTDPLAAVNNLSTFIFGLIRAIGLILLAFGIVQIGLSLKSHDPSQRANGFLTFAGGIVIAFTKEILALITG